MYTDLRLKSTLNGYHVACLSIHDIMMLLLSIFVLERKFP